MANSEKTEKRGRPAAGVRSGEYQVDRRVSIDNKTADFLRAYGNGNLSAGVRMAAAFISEWQTREVNTKD